MLVWTDKSISVIQKKNGKEHDHEGVCEENLKKQEIRNAIKRKAQEEVHVEPTKIIR